MTSPVDRITVECPRCRTVFEDWYRPSVNLDLEGWDPEDPEVADYLRECSTATCPSCKQVIELGALAVKDGVWRFPPAYAEAVAPLVDRDAEGRETEAGRRLREHKARLDEEIAKLPDPEGRDEA